MNCPVCAETLSFTPSGANPFEIETYQCPVCVLAGVARSPVFKDPEQNPVTEYRRHVTPEQLRELVESCPADAPTLQVVLSLLWSHYCWSVRLLIQGGASPASLVALALARSEVAEPIRNALKQGGAQ